MSRRERPSCDPLEFSPEIGVFENGEHPETPQYGFDVQARPSRQDRDLSSGRDLRKAVEKSLLELVDAELVVGIDNIDEMVRDPDAVDDVIGEVFPRADVHTR